MKTLSLLALIFSIMSLGYQSDAETAIFPDLKRFILARVSEFDQISDDRKLVLDRLAEHISQSVSAQQPCRLVFVCTHNSRRSHLSQAWAQVAAVHFEIPGVECFSGGTEATAFNARTVAAMRRAGFEINVAKGEESVANPKYQVRFNSSGRPLECFSKRTNDDPNPQKDFAAIMTCSEADKACPTVSGSSFRLGLPFDDPKVSDGTPEESQIYDLRCRQIAREMLYVMSQVKRL
jgi:protein-tyrosine-phosphatase